MSLTTRPSSAPARSPRSPRRTASTATSSRSTRCGPPTRSAPASSTCTARPTSPAHRRSPRSPCSPPRPGAATAPASTSRSASRSTAPAVRRACFSISSPDSAPRRPVHGHVRANPDGVVSKLPGRRAPRPGTIVHLSQAEGEFMLPDPLPDHVLFISGGSGITPVMSMLRTLLRRGSRAAAVTFLHYAQSAEHQIFADELDEIRRPATASTCTCCTPSSATRSSRRA